LVRFFGKSKTSAATTKDGEGPAATPRTSASAARLKEAAAAESAEEPKKAAVRRRTTSARPPRRDWAAEAADTPMETASPRPSSLASAPTEDSDTPAGPAKRRRGTRGGRGRKKPGAATAETATTATAPTPLPRRSAQPLTLEEALAQQSAVLDRFATDVTASLKSLQSTVADLQSRLDGAPSANGKAHPRVGIFVDVPNLIYAAERRKVQIDFGRVLAYFTRDRELVRASAYAPITDDPQAKLESQRFVHHFMGHPYRIITKPLKRFADGSMKANFDIELAIDILTMSDRLDVVVLMSGDGDFRRVVELVASRGVRVEVVAFSETAAMELKAVADLYVDIGQHMDDFKVLK
jgi:uncharacterized LabA/DUF88 family protein